MQLSLLYSFFISCKYY